MAKKTIKYNSASLRWELLDASSTVISYATGNPTDNPWELAGWKTTSGSLTLTAGGTVDATALSSHILYGETAYARGRKLTGTIVDAKITTTDTAITVSPGYVGTEVVCPISGGASVGISYGYINSDGLFQELDLSGNSPAPVGTPEEVDSVVFTIPVDEPNYGESTTAESSDIRAGKTAVLNGLVTAGSMPNSGISVSGNEVTITAGYCAGSTEVIGEALQAAEYTIGDSNVVIPAGKYLVGPQTIKPAEVVEATVTETGNQVVITAGYITDQTITIGEALPAQEYTVGASDIVIPAGKYLSGAQTIKSPGAANVTTTDNVVNITGGLIGAQSVTVGTALSGNTYTPGPSNIVIPAGSYLTGDQIIEAVTGGDGGSMDFYRCTEYDNGGVIPAYSNIAISGVTSPTAVNTTLVQVDKKATEINRVWQAGDYRMAFDPLAGYWCLYDKETILPWAETALFRLKIDGLSDNSGTSDNPTWWDTFVDSATRWKTPEFNMGTISSSYYKRYFYIRLKKDTAYTLGMTIPQEWYSGNLYLYDSAGTTVASSSSSTETINGVTVGAKLAYTPTADGVFKLEVNSGYDTYDVEAVICYPAPETSTPPATDPWAYTSWEAVNGAGSVALAPVAVAERAATGVKKWSGYKGVLDEATKTWSFSDTITTNLAVAGYNPRVGEVYSADTSVWVQNLKEATPAGGLMVCLVHCDDAPIADDKWSVLFIDDTETCIIKTDSQTSIKHEHPKFGSRSWYTQNLGSGSAALYVNNLPELDAFTAEWWQYSSMSSGTWGGLALALTTSSGTRTTIETPELPATNPNRKAKRYFHHALVREAGSSYVFEYVDGVPIYRHSFTPKLGGTSVVGICTGGTSGSNTNNYGDELAIFNYAKYNGEFHPPAAPYDTIISGLGKGNNPERDVTVSGIKVMHFANDPSYQLQDASATGSSRVWATADGKWYIYWDMDRTYGWVVANGTSAWNENWICAAMLEDDDNDQSANDFNPIGHSGWVDYNDQTVAVSVIDNSTLPEEPEDSSSSTTTPDDGGDNVVATAEDLVVSDCGLEAFNGVYKIQTPGSTGQDRKWVHTSGNSAIYWSGGHFAWLLCEEPNDNGDENDFRTYADDPAGATWSAVMSTSYNPPTVTYGGGSDDSSSSTAPDTSSSTSLKVSGAADTAVNGVYELISGNANDLTGKWQKGEYYIYCQDPSYPDPWIMTTNPSYNGSPWINPYYKDASGPVTGQWTVGSAASPAPIVEWASSDDTTGDGSYSDGGGDSTAEVDYTKVQEFKFAGFSPEVDGDGFESVFMSSTFYRRTDLSSYSYIWADSADSGYNKEMHWNGSRWEISMGGPGTIWYTTESNPFTAQSWTHYSGSTVAISFKDIVTDTNNPCFVAGTLITLADGTTKAVEDITYADELMVYNFDEGKLDTAKPAWIMQTQHADSYQQNTFSDGTVLNTVGASGTMKAHRMFSVDQQKFVYMGEAVGDTTYTLNGECQLVSSVMVQQPCEYHNIITKEHFNLFANGVLTSNRFSNMYPIKDMRYIKTAKAAQEYPGIPEDMVKDFRLDEQNVDIEYLNRLISLKK